MSSVMASAEPVAPRANGPPPPATLVETGLSAESVDELLLRTLHVTGAQTGRSLTDSMALPFEVVDARLLRMQERRFVEVVGTQAPNRGSYTFDLTDAGRARAEDALRACQYVGPAPVPLKLFEEWVLRQAVDTTRLSRSRIEDAFRDLVLPAGMFDVLGPAINSGRSIFLHGEAGNGKTTVAEATARVLGGTMFVPFAVDVAGQVVIVFDPSHHERVEPETPPSPGWLRPPPEYDPRFAVVRRPVVTAGGELGMEQLDLQYDPHTRTYQAPFQLKAAGGVLIIDDFGRQRMPPHELLNRWIVPLEKRYDFLTLQTGVKFRVPFEALLIFATNLEPADLVDEAFLRRIQYKLHIDGPDRAAYEEIFRRICIREGIAFDPAAVDFVYREYYDASGIPPRACHPRDIMEHVIAAAKYEGVPPRLGPEHLRMACDAYFLVVASDALLRRRRGTTGQVTREAR